MVVQVIKEGRFPPLINGILDMEKTQLAPLPPMMSGKLPILGHALAFAKDRFGLFQRGHAEHGNIFRFKLANKTAVAMLGPEFHTFFFKETDKSLDMSKPYSFMKPIFGEVAFVADHATYLNQRPMLYSPFERQKMNRYIQIMDETVKKWIATMPEEGRFELTAVLNDLVQEVAGRAIMGDDFMERAGKAFWDDYTVVGKALDPLLPPNLPLPKFIRRDKARKRMMATLKPILAERRAYPGQYDDFLQDFLQTKQADGSDPSDEELLGMIIALLFAGHETTAGQAAWTIIQLLQHPAYLEKVRAELAVEFPQGSTVDAKTMAKLKHLKWAIDETSRLKPSADLIIRVADQELEIGGFRIPKDAVVFLSPEMGHRLEAVFKDADAYNPLRFGPSECPHKSQKNAIIGFGGGVHKCPGMNFALTEMLTITAHLLQNFDLELETKNPSQRHDLGASRPTETWVSFKRKPVEMPKFEAGEKIPEAVRAMALAAGCTHF